MKIGIIDSSISNSRSVYNAIKYLGHEPILIDNPREIHLYRRIILPGVGSYPSGMRVLNDTGFSDEIRVYKNGILLGICLGMQLLLSKGYEFGETQGLDLIPGNVIKIPTSFVLPNIGWREGVISGLSYYFVHSYMAETSKDYLVDQITYQGTIVTSEIRKDNYWGVQFHPEKSSNNGLKYLTNYINYE